MPVDQYGRWFETADHPTFNSAFGAVPAIPDGMAAVAFREIAEWTGQRHPPVPQPAGQPLPAGRRRRLVPEPGLAQANPMDGVHIDMANIRVPHREPEDRANNREWLKQYKPLNLKELPEAKNYDRGVKLSPFRVEYDSHEQIYQKLHGSVILVKGWPYIVHGTIDKGRGKFALLLADRAGSLAWIDYDDVSDTRSVAPGYVNYNSYAYWVYRIPDRQNHQGHTSRNTFMRAAGTDGRPSGMQTNIMLTCMHSRKNILFQPNLLGLIENGIISSVRLSNNLALHKVKNKGAICGVEYIGRPLGLIVDDRLKVLDDSDLAPTWIHKDCAEVNLELY